MTTYSWKTEYLKDRKKWRIRIELGEDAQGKRKYQTKTLKAKTKREALEEGRIYYEKFIKGEYVNADLTFGEFVEEWREKYAERHLSPITLQNHNSMLRKHILPVFGHKKIKDINIKQSIDFIQHLEEKQLLPTSIEYIKNLLKSIFNVAIKWQIADHNPINNVTVSKGAKKEVEVFSEEEIRKLLEGLEQEPARTQALIKLALSTGMRKGELLGLQWEDVDFAAGTINITKSLKYVHGTGFILDSTKTKKSRVITIDSNTSTMLKEYKRIHLKQRLVLGDMWKGTQYNFIFTNSQGSPVHLNEPNQLFKNLLNKNNLKITKFHALRHTHATFLLRKGVNVKVIQTRLGHTNINMTLNTYAHVLREMDFEATQHFETLFKRA
ncbi:hypothetical protein IEQ_04876 [Bacillus cereus BAG6X1-2]|nr:hypothetical protein IEQ_04876 [Bacillus cereus BAG6X1-2]